MQEIGQNLKSIPLVDIIPHPKNPRKTIEGKALEELAASLASMGQLQPGVVRPHPEQPGKYQLLCGHRRHVALGKANLPEMINIVREVDDLAALKILITENMHREDFTPLEESKGVKLLLEVGKGHQDIADDLGKSLSWVYKRERLADLHPKLVAMVENPKENLSRASAEYLGEIAAFPADVQMEWLERDNAPWSYDQLCSLGNLRRWIADRTRLLKKAGWDLDDATLCPMAGSCRGCSKRSGASPELFELNETTIGKEDRCLDGKCWSEKVQAYAAQRITEAKARNPLVRQVESKNGYMAQRPGGVLSNHSYEVVKKNTPGAEEAVVVNGDDAGKLIWIIGPQNSPEELPARKVKDVATSGTPEQKRDLLEIKRMELLSRRVAHALNLLRDLLQSNQVVEHFAKLEPVMIMELAVLYGTRNIQYGSTEWDAREKAQGDFTKIFTRAIESVADVQEQLALLVAPMMAMELHVNKSTDVGERPVRHARFICSVLGILWKDFLDKAEEALPEPKAWKALDTGAAPRKKKVKSEEEPISDSVGEQIEAAAEKPRKAKRKPSFSKSYSPEEWEALSDEEKAQAMNPNSDDGGDLRSVSEIINDGLAEYERNMNAVAGKKRKGKAKTKAAGKKGGAK